MSMKLREIIKAVRACKTAEEERSVINKEAAEIRNLPKDQSDQLKARNILKCIYMHFLGFSTTFINLPCVNLLASSKFTDKRIAYMALPILLDESSEVLLLTCQTIKKDLESSNQYIVGCALIAIAEICKPDMCRDMCSEVIKLMNDSNPFIKKRVALALLKIARVCPDLIDTFSDKLDTYFTEKNNGVMICGLELIKYIFSVYPKSIKKYRKYLNNLFRFIKELISVSYYPEYEVNGIIDPFLQAKIIEIFKFFGQENVNACEEISDVLANVTNSIESNKNTGNAILYELVRTIIEIEADAGLKSISTTILGKFLSNRDPNYKYIALNTLREVAKEDLQSVQKHKNVILECLRDSDISIKRRALDLIYLIVNSSNIKQIMKECLNFLLTAESDFKLELTTKIAQSLEKYSPSIKWQIDNIVKMLSISSNFVSENIISSIINVIIANAQLHIYSVHKLFIAIRNNYANQEALVKVAVYVIGELGDLLLQNPIQAPDDEIINVFEKDLVELFRILLEQRYSDSGVKEYILNAILKLSTKLNVTGNAKEEFKNLNEKQKTAFDNEVQQRAVEYSLFHIFVKEEMKNLITSNIPVHKSYKDNEVQKEIFNSQFDDEIDPSYKNQYVSLILNEENKSKNPMKNNFSSSNQNKNLIENIVDFSKTDQSKIEKTTGNLLGDLTDVFSALNTNNPNNINLLDINNVQATNYNINNNLDINNLLSYTNQTNTNPLIQNPSNNSTNRIEDIMDLLTISKPAETNNINNNINLLDLNVNNNFINNNPINLQTNKIHEFFKNEEVSFSFSLNKTFDGSINSTFYMSNLKSKQLTNVKINFSVQKFVTLKVLSTSGNTLNPMESRGVKKEINVVNNEPERKVIIRLKYLYTVEGVEVLSKLGEGAYSVVHKTRRLVDGNIYALKRVKLLNLSEKEKLNALNEVRILASVKSNYVISYKEAFYDENDNVLAIVMEYADKGDLYQKICEFKKASVSFEESDIWRIFIQILKGLKALHEMKILHRDLKSANVFLFNDGSAKLGDLNVSKVARRGLGYTQTGTPYYASPEVWKDQPYDSKSDIWSLGCVLYEMITLRPPFRAENMEGQFSKISDRYSSDLHEIVKLLIQVQPEARPSCDQLLKHPIIMKRMDFFKNIDDNEESSLLQTIRVPKNLLFLTDKLPQPNYEKIPNKRNLSFTNNKNELPDINGKNIHRIKKNKKVEKKDITKDKKEYSENKENRERNHNNDENEEEILIKKSEKIEDDQDEAAIVRKKKIGVSLDHSQLSGRKDNSGINHNIKVIKNTDLDNINNSIVREKSPANDEKRKIKDINNPNIMLPNIKGISSVDGKYEDSRSARNKEEYYKKKKAEELKNIAKMLPYVNNEHISNIYKILAPPYIKNNLSIQNPTINKNGNSAEKNSLKNLQKYYEYAAGHNYKVKKSSNNPNLDLSINYAPSNIKIVPNRKLSPINNPMKKMIKI